MRDFIILLVHLIVTVIRLAGPKGSRSVVAESALLRHQLLILNRGRKRAPNLRDTDRIAAGLFTLFMGPVRVVRRIRSAHYRPASHRAGPSWLTFLGHMIDLRKQEAFSSTPPACSALPRGTRSRSVLPVVAKFALGPPIFAARQRQKHGEGNSDGATPGWFHDLLHSRRLVNSKHHRPVVSSAERPGKFLASRA